MAVHGYITHAAHNRRLTALLVAAYVLAFELIGAFALTIFLLIFDEEHTIISDPVGYLVRYGIPVALVAGLMFWWMYGGHARTVARRLRIRTVTRQDEPRFVDIAEQQCIALGVRLPRFGVIETPERNALTVGEGPNKGLIAVTRGLLDGLDDDELAAILAHEASHVRHGDTKLLAANHALMRTAVILQTHNPLRLDDWRQVILFILIPPMLILTIMGSAATMMSMQLARAARSGLKLTRDHVADGEAIRVTHFPEALISALGKVRGRSFFEGSHRVEGLLFDGPEDHEGGSHPAVQDRIDAISSLGRDLMNPDRRRRDTRPKFVQAAAGGGFGRRGSSLSARLPNGRPMEQPPRPDLNMLAMFLTDRERFWEWQNACIDWHEWRREDKRNAIGMTPQMLMPMAATVTFLAVFHWPADGDLYKLKEVFNPMALVEIARKMEGGTFCSGPAYTDGKCPVT
jgi:Zn-dependent protease with chaperone function